MTNQFKATTLWNKFLHILNVEFQSAPNNQLSGKEIYNSVFKYFGDNGTKMVTEEKILQLCTLLIDTFVIHESTNVKLDVTHFKKTNCAMYNSCPMNFDNNSHSSLTSKPRTSGIGKFVAMIRSVIPYFRNKTDMVEGATMQSQCLERRLAMMSLLKILDIPMIQGLVDLCQSTLLCNHTLGNYSWTCDIASKFEAVDVHLQGGDMLFMHYNCIIKMFEKNYTDFVVNKKIITKACPFDLDLIDISDHRLIGIIRYLSVNPDILKWYPLTDVFQQLSEIVNFDSNQKKALQCFQLAFNLLPDIAQHITYHICCAISLFLIKTTNTPVKNKIIRLFCESLFPNAENNEPYNKFDLLLFIVNNYDKLLLLPDDLRHHIAFLREQSENIVITDETIAPIFSTRITTRECKDNSAMATENALRGLYNIILNRQGRYRHLTTVQWLEELKTFRHHHSMICDIEDNR